MVHKQPQHVNLLCYNFLLSRSASDSLRGSKAFDTHTRAFLTHTHTPTISPSLFFLLCRVAEYVSGSGMLMRFAPCLACEWERASQYWLLAPFQLRRTSLRTAGAALPSHASPRLWVSDDRTSAVPARRGERVCKCEARSGRPALAKCALSWPVETRFATVGGLSDQWGPCVLKVVTFACGSSGVPSILICRGWRAQTGKRSELQSILKNENGGKTFEISSVAYQQNILAGPGKELKETPGVFKVYLCWDFVSRQVCICFANRVKQFHSYWTQDTGV